MWRIWILLCSALLAESQNADYVDVLFGHQLSIRMPSVRSDSLEFTSADETQHYTIWSKVVSKRGSVIGSGDDRRFVIYSVTFDDQGTYTRKNFWDKVTAVTKLKVLPKRSSRDCVAGETLRISLEGIRRDEASLRFSRDNENLMLVDRGSPVRDHPDYIGRVKVTTNSIEVLNVNVTDEGNYTLFDGKNRKAVTIRMFIVDHHPPNHAPFMALLLLLGIPAGVCCCCRKRICRKNSQATATTTVQSHNVVVPPGPPPDYNTPMVPAGPGPMYTPGYPAPGESQVHPPPNPAYPVQPQYGGQPAMPPNPMYTPGCPAPGDSQIHPPPSNPAYPPLPQYGGQPAMPPNPGFAPVMYNAPAGSEIGGNKEGIKMSELSPAAPLLGPTNTEVGPPQAPYPSTDVLNSSNPTVQYNSSNYNFL
ncbi:uncharacterized protein LOC103026353 isoform X1 [Astyanax mexicanus]|uniref:uncharacterized protein LOC103026353 isoform X1 n=1 Tax=Astyanax mexicanus TaxID=7994 RepID=UPI0020CAA9E3|nr:uncharacterized protein LOC103026353 isoform X1 [Astyanax mexicanus]